METQFQFQLFCFVLFFMWWAKKIDLLIDSHHLVNEFFGDNFSDPFSDSPKIARFPKNFNNNNEIESWKILCKIQHFWIIGSFVQYIKHKQFTQ